MQAFLALAWDETDARAQAAAERLLAYPELANPPGAACMIQRGIAVFNMSPKHHASEFIRLKTGSDDVGAIIGPIFRQSPAKTRIGPIQALNSEESARLIDSAGASLIANFWGSYVAILRTADAAWIVTDPTSAIPCFYTTHEHVTLVFSHLEKCPFVSELRLTINEPFVVQLLTNDKVQTGETGLQEIRELGGGRRLRVSKNGFTEDALWQPFPIAEAPYAPDSKVAAAELRDTIRYVIAARASQFRRITVSLSGGLDSAIVLACASDDLEAQINALHQFSTSGDPSEYHYARQAAASVGCDLIPVEIDARRALPHPVTHPLTTRPHRAFISPDIAALVPDASHNLGEALFTGEGGDHLLHHSRTALNFADHLLHHGLSRHTVKQLLSSARLSEQSIWQVAFGAWPHLSGRLGNSLKSIHALPPAKSEQVRRFSHMLHVRDVMDQSRERRIVHPLISQPLIELCLRLPTYLLSLNGVSRGLAREAFADIIPDNIRTRMSKGNATRHAIQIIEANRDLIGDVLLDGELVRRRLLDREVILKFLREDEFRLLELGRRMLVYYAIEAWLTRWSSFLRTQVSNR